MNEEERSRARVEGLIFSYIDRIKEEFEQRLVLWKEVECPSEVREVIGALLSRQATLARELAKSPDTWTGHIAPLILRAMTDLYINFAWILKDPEDRSQKFIYYGLGEEKKKLEFQRAEMKGSEPSEEQLEMLQAIEDWINFQRYTFLTNVNLANWSGINARDMAKEAGCLDFYNYVYNPFSGCTHSMWQHVARYNAALCDNPLHGLHFVPCLLDAPHDFHYVHLASKYLQKTFSAFDSAFGIQISGNSSYKILHEEFEKFKQQHDEEGG